MNAKQVAPFMSPDTHRPTNSGEPLSPIHWQLQHSLWLIAELLLLLAALVALALIGGSWHIGVSARQNLRLTAEALESGYIGKGHI